MNRKLANVTAVFLVWFFCCGCVTKRLWEEKSFNEPSPESNLRVYYSRPKGDVLVVYDELLESSSTVRRRAYYLSQQPAPNHKPTFVDVSATNQMHELTLVARTNSFLPPATNAYVVRNDNDNFSVALNGQLKGPYELPVYPSGLHQGTPIALTPLALLADTVLVASIAGAVVVYWYAEGGKYR